MARDKVIDSLTTEVQEDSAPVTRHDVAEVMDVSLVREMMMKMQMEAGEQLALSSRPMWNIPARSKKSCSLRCSTPTRTPPMAASTALRTSRASRTLRNSRIPPTMTTQAISTRSWSSWEGSRNIW